MHNAAFEGLGLDYVYLPFRVREEELEKAAHGIRALNIRGLNVTMPHKVAIINFLDRLDPLAERIGAVNTVVNDEGILTGYNTDATGFLQALLEKGIEPKGRRVAVIGAGGASRAISFALAERGASLIILNRHRFKAEELAKRIASFNQNVKALALDERNLAEALSWADVLVNATSLGMSPEVDKTPVPAGMLRQNLVIFDIVYTPLKTRLLREAEQAGARIVEGLDMLVRQAALSFEIWTGMKAPIELMREAARRALGEDQHRFDRIHGSGKDGCGEASGKKARKGIR